MKLFLDTSVLIAAIGSGTGTARFIIAEAASRSWKLATADYCVEETRRNWSKLRQSPAVSAHIWETVILPKIKILPVRLVLDKLLVFTKSKDRPVLITALASECDWLLTFDTGDFQTKLGQSVYNVKIGAPGEFLRHQIQHGAI